MKKVRWLWITVGVIVLISVVLVILGSTQYQLIYANGGFHLSPCKGPFLSSTTGKVITGLPGCAPSDSSPWRRVIRQPIIEHNNCCDWADDAWESDEGTDARETACDLFVGGGCCVDNSQELIDECGFTLPLAAGLCCNVINEPSG